LNALAFRSMLLYSFEYANDFDIGIRDLRC
jgi:hypothetical protein